MARSTSTSSGKSSGRKPARGAATTSGSAKKPGRGKATTAKPTKASGRKSSPDVPALRGTSYSEWKLTGVSPQTRTAVKRAAHKEGLSVDAWVDKTLQSAASQTIQGGNPLLSLPPELLSTIGEIGQKVDRIEARLNESAPQSFWPGEGVGQATEEFRKKAGNVFDEMQKSTSQVMHSVAEHTDSTVSQIKSVSNSAIERIREATDAALENVRGGGGRGRQDDRGDQSSADAAKKE